MFIHFVGLCGNGTGAMLACFCTKTRTNCNWVVGCNNFPALSLILSLKYWFLLALYRAALHSIVTLKSRFTEVWILVGIYGQNNLSEVVLAWSNLWIDSVEIWELAKIYCAIYLLRGRGCWTLDEWSWDTWTMMCVCVCVNLIYDWLNTRVSVYTLC